MPALVQELTSTRQPQLKQEKKCVHLLAMMSERGYCDSCVLLVQDLISQISSGRHCCGRVPAAGVGRVGAGAAERAAVGASRLLALAAAAALSVCFGAAHPRVDRAHPPSCRHERRRSRDRTPRRHRVGHQRGGGRDAGAVGVTAAAVAAPGRVGEHEQFWPA